MRKAGSDFFREQILASNRADPVGRGTYGVVYESDVPGRVMKQTLTPDTEDDLTKEANLQLIAADLGIAPRVTTLETFPGGVGNRIEMEDIRNNYDPMQAPGTAPKYLEGKVALDTAKQLGMLALKGVDLQDRFTNNVFQHKMTGRPKQIDFGIADEIKHEKDKARLLAGATADGFAAAGIPDMGDILYATVNDYLEGGQVAEAMDIARQGFSRLQKIKHPLKASVDLLQG
jgi:hypothetical protein